MASKNKTKLVKVIVMTFNYIPQLFYFNQLFIKMYSSIWLSYMQNSQRIKHKDINKKII